VMRSRFDTAVAVSVAAVLGTVGFFVVGMEVFVWTVLLVPVLAPVLVSVAALGGVWLVVRGDPSAKGFGGGMLVGWVLLALWTSGMSVGLSLVTLAFRALHRTNADDRH
jgi:hypothetical protein